MSTPPQATVPRFSPARSILLLEGVELDFSEERIQIASNLIMGRIAAPLVEELREAGLNDVEQFVDGLDVFVEFRGTTSTQDLLRPRVFAAALALSSDLAIHPAAHIIADVVSGSTSGAPLPHQDFHWGHYRRGITGDDIASALPLVAPIEEVRITEIYNRVGNALLFYENGYNSENPDLALVAFTTCLEGLFSTVEQEISFRLALRLAHFLGDSKDAERETYEQCREVYKVRSKIVHGAPIMKRSEPGARYLVEHIVPLAENLARTSLHKIFHLRLEGLFNQQGRVEALFDELLFSDSLADALDKIER